MAGTSRCSPSLSCSRHCCCSSDAPAVHARTAGTGMSLLSACVHCFSPESAVIPLGLRVVETTGLLGVRPLSFHRVRVCPIMELKLRRKHCYVGKREGEPWPSHLSPRTKPCLSQEKPRTFLLDELERDVLFSTKKSDR